MQVIVLGGGDSPEREVSFRSAAAVADAGRRAGFEITSIDPAQSDDWLTNVTPGTVVLPILHGKGGEDGEIQSKLEKKPLPFLGSGSTASAECFDKWQTRHKLEAAGLPVAKGQQVNNETYKLSELAKLPHVLKISNGGSSIGTLVVRDPSRVDESKVAQIFAMEKNAIIEELIIGTEATVPILDQTALPVIEIIPPQGYEFDYENKYNGQTQELCPPASIPENLQQACQRLAEEVHKVMGCRHLSRVDIMIDEAGNLFVLEINTIPGLTDQSLYPKSAAVAGINMPDLISKFVDLANRDYQK